MDALTVDTGPEPAWTVIRLHGLGADGHDFEPIVPLLVAPHWPSIRFVFPHAPMRPVTVNGGMRMRAWYDISALDLDRTQDEAGIRASRALVAGYVTKERERGMASGKIFLAGFSQGGAMTVASGVTYPERLAGLIVLSGYVPIADSLDRERHPESHGVAVFQGHGTHDPIVPLQLGEHSRAWLAARGHPVAWKTYPIPHSVSPEEVADLRMWMESRLS